MRIIAVEKNTQSLSVTWEDGFESQFDYLWLRDNCPTAFHPTTHERNFNLLSVPDTLSPQTVSHTDQQLTVAWAVGEHQSQFTAEWLYKNDYSRHAGQHAEEYLKNEAWDASYADNIRRANYQQIIDSDDALLQWLRDLYRYGLTVVEAMPDSDNAVMDVARRVAHLRETNFGLTFDVRSKPNPNNQAYTAEALPLHTDLPNQELPPGYQFLHCLQNESSGGESTFLDGFAAANLLRQQNEEHFNLLSSQPIQFKFADTTHSIHEKKPIIVLNADGEVDEINYNAHLAQTFILDKTLMRSYYLAYRHLMKILHDESLLIKFKLGTGQMVVFDNRRVLHGRTAFDPQTGRRHLRGCYIDRGDLKSRIRILEQR